MEAIMHVSSTFLTLALAALPLCAAADPLHNAMLTPQTADWAPAKERYQAIVLNDPEERQKISGFFNLFVVDTRRADRDRDLFPAAAPELMRYMRDQTHIEAQVGSAALRLSDPAIFSAPVLYMTGNDGILSPSQTARENLVHYLRNGGFLFAEEIRQTSLSTGLPAKGAGVKGTPFDMQFKALIKDPLVLGSEGRHWQKVPLDHPIYSSYWDFVHGPPLGGAPGGNVFDLELLEVRGRVVAVFSDLNISWYWGDPAVDARERALQFGTNLMVFALTQPGGLANTISYIP
jgi:hypothetical protein